MKSLNIWIFLQHWRYALWKVGRDCIDCTSSSTVMVNANKCQTNISVMSATETWMWKWTVTTRYFIVKEWHATLKLQNDCACRSGSKDAYRCPKWNTIQIRQGSGSNATSHPHINTLVKGHLIDANYKYRPLFSIKQTNVNHLDLKRKHTRAFMDGT